MKQPTKTREQELEEEIKEMKINLKRSNDEKDTFMLKDINQDFDGYSWLLRELEAEFKGIKEGRQLQREEDRKQLQKVYKKIKKRFDLLKKNLEAKLLRLQEKKT
jgi:SUMO ligase MMS21 Smc5/6 complex component